MKYRFRNEFPTEASRLSVLDYSPIVDDPTDGIATMRLYDPIDNWGGGWGVSAKEFAQALATLPADTHTIQLHINSPGGMVFEGVAILNQLRQHSAKVVAVVDGLAASAASFIACGSDELQMAPNSQMMIHDAYGLEIGDAATMRKYADLLDRLSNNIAAIYAAKAGGTVEDWRAAMLAESWYSPEEAVAAGLADQVAGVEPPAYEVADAAASFDGSAFRYQGRADAPAPLIAARGGFPGRVRQRLDAAGVRHGLT